MPFELPTLKYSYDALEPYIDAQTMEIHFSKHHAAYVNNLNKALETHPQLANSTVEELLMNLDTLPDDVKTVIRNNAGGHYNHTLFWNWLTPTPSIGPEGTSAEEINKVWGSLDNFKTEFAKAGMSRFGSGWAWLVLDKSGKLFITSTANQDNPISEGKTPILGLDVWEHAYYLKYQNKRADYITAWWNVVDWAEVEKSLQTTLK